MILGIIAIGMLFHVRLISTLLALLVALTYSGFILMNRKFPLKRPLEAQMWQFSAAMLGTALIYPFFKGPGNISCFRTFFGLDDCVFLALYRFPIGFDCICNQKNPGQ